MIIEGISQGRKVSKFTLMDGKDYNFYINQILKAVSLPNFDPDTFEDLELEGLTLAIKIEPKLRLGEIKEYVTSCMPASILQIPTFDESDLQELVEVTRNSVRFKSFIHRMGDDPAETISKAKKMIRLLNKLIDTLERQIDLPLGQTLNEDFNYEEEA